MATKISPTMGLSAPVSSASDSVPFADATKRLVGLKNIGLAVFEGEDAPSERTLRSLTKRGILPHYKIARLVRYDPTAVRVALEMHCLVQKKGNGRAK